ncbi:hypothetical protein Tco_0519457 [Tanacetum coccineum]
MQVATTYHSDQLNRRTLQRSWKRREPLCPSPFTLEVEEVAGRLTNGSMIRVPSDEIVQVAGARDQRNDEMVLASWWLLLVVIVITTGSVVVPPGSVVVPPGSVVVTTGSVVVPPGSVVVPPGSVVVTW